MQGARGDTNHTMLSGERYFRSGRTQGQVDRVKLSHPKPGRYVDLWALERARTHGYSSSEEELQDPARVRLQPEQVGVAHTQNGRRITRL